MNSHQQYIDLFRQQHELICRNSCQHMNNMRDAAIEQFAAKGLPGRKEEDYLYTDVAAAFAPDYGMNLAALPIPFDTRRNLRCSVPNLLTDMAYLVAEQPLLPTPIPYVSTLRQASIEHPEVVARYYNQSGQADALRSFNTAFAQDGLFVYVPKGCNMPKPLQVLATMQNTAPMTAVRRILVVLEEQSEATILLCDHSLSTAEALTSTFIEVYAGADSSFRLYEIEENNSYTRRFANLHISAESGSHICHTTVSLSSGTTRNDVVCNLLGPNVDLTLNGCVIADAEQHVDNHTLINHIAPDCRSRQLYKYVADEQAVGAFAGKILVGAEAQHTDSRETNANLCASPQAHIYSQPMLEIYADDVQCSHGSTVGVLDESALFYMQQRGIPVSEARLLLKNAFTSDVIDQITLEPLRHRIRNLIEQRFRGGSNKCNGCSLCE